MTYRLKFTNTQEDTKEVSVELTARTYKARPTLRQVKTAFADWLGLDYSDLSDGELLGDVFEWSWPSGVIATAQIVAEA